MHIKKFANLAMFSLLIMSFCFFGLIAMAAPSAAHANDIPVGSLGDLVWNDLNRNGIQDAGEPGMNGITVNLFNSADIQVALTTTGSNGSYLFSGLLAGEYRLQFSLPGGYMFSPKNLGGDPAFDSNVDWVGNAGVNFPGGVDLTVDAGMFLIPVGSIGDLVWNDLNRNGIQDAGEPGITGAQVELYGGVANNAVHLIAATTTDPNGLFAFTGLSEGSYAVKFMLAEGFGAFSPKFQGGNPSQDSNPGADGFTDIFSLAAGEVNYTIDAGMYPSISVVPVPGTLLLLGSGLLSGLAWRRFA